MAEVFIGREKEMGELEELYRQNKFQLFILYGRRRVGKTTLLTEFCKGKDSMFFSADLTNAKLNLQKFSTIVFDHYGEQNLEPFSSWTNALTYVNTRQAGRRLVLVIDEFPYLVKKNRALMTEFQHLIDHTLRTGNMFVILSGSYMSFMEKEVLASKSPLFGRRTGQLHLKPFSYKTGIKILESFSPEDKIKLYGAFGGTPLYLQQVQPECDFEENIKKQFLRVTAYLYEEPLLLLRQEVQEPGVYCAIIEAIAGGAAKANEISTKIGEEAAKCIKYIKILCELGILYRETPFGEKESSRKTVYGISDFMFRFWYRYVFANKTLVETGAANAVWKRHIEPTYSEYMGLVFERICEDYLKQENAEGKLPILFTSIGRWWGANPKDRSQVEIDLIAKDGNSYLICECKWRNGKTDLAMLKKLKEKADAFKNDRGETWFVLFSKSGFTDALACEAQQDGHVLLVNLEDML